jgi:hypothetical protein
MLALNPQERRRCSSIANSLFEFEQYILDLEPFQLPRQVQPQPQSQQRATYGYPLQQQPQHLQPQPVSQQPMYYQGQGQPIRGGSYQAPTSFGQPGQPVYGYRPQGVMQHQGPGPM